MAETPAAVYELLNEVWTPALDRAKEEMAEMNAMLQRDVPGATFEPWDWWYYAEKVRKDKYALDDAALRPYFSLENVREGAFSLANRLYGITFRPLVAPVYHKDCSVYEVLDVDGTHLGVLYFDFFSAQRQEQRCVVYRVPQPALRRRRTHRSCGRHRMQFYSADQIDAFAAYAR